MANGATDPTTRPTTGGATRQVVEFGTYIDGQLAKVRSYVRLGDLLTIVTALALAAGAFLFLLVLIDHWIMDLRRWGRLLGFIILLLGTAALIIRGVVPLLIRRINPAYAARIIERSQPSLRNSLTDIVFFRRQPDSLRKVVYDLVERQAATDLSRVEVEGAVDHTPLIRLGTSLAALLIAFVVYTWVSPKNSLDSVARVLIPWSERSRPSRVQIQSIEPGHAQVYAGRFLQVSAVIDDLAEAETPALIYSSVDGQVSQRRLPMKRSSDQTRWQVQLPPGKTGIFEDLVYEVHAGDAVAGPFRVMVLPSPSIVVDKLEYAYPEYTRIDDLTIEGQGHITAIEGTRVRLHARSNQDIRFAYVEFDPLQSDGAPWDKNATTPEKAERPTRSTLPMKHDGQHAWTSFTLALKPDRITPWHSSYHIRFENTSGETNDRPIQYRIQVTPDVPPHVEILTPMMREISLPEDSRQTIEIRAVDPDYGLSDVRLRAVSGATPLFEEQLLAETVSGQQVLKYDFAPRQHGLQAGELVVYWAVASDNRTDPKSGSPSPNVTNSTQYRFRITAASDQSADQQNNESRDPKGSEADNQGEADKQTQSDDGRQQQPGAEQARDDSGQTRDPGTDSQNQGENGENQPETGTQQSPATDETGNQREGQSNNQETSDAPGNNQESAPDPNATSSQQDSGNAGSSHDDSNKAKQNGPGNRNNSNESRESQPAGERNGTGQDDSPRGGRPQDSAGDQQEGSRSDGADENASGSTSQNKSPGRDTTESPANDFNTDDSRPLPSDGSRDGDAMERILNRIKQKTGRSPNGQQPQPVACDQCTDGTCPDCQAAKKGNGENGRANAGQRRDQNSGDAEKNSGAGQSERSSPKDRADEQRPAGNGSQDKQRQPDAGTDANDGGSNGEPSVPQADKATDDGQDPAATQRNEPSSANKGGNDGNRNEPASSDRPRSDNSGAETDGSSADDTSNGEENDDGPADSGANDSRATDGSGDAARQTGNNAPTRQQNGSESSTAEASDSTSPDGGNSDRSESSVPANDSSDTPGPPRADGQANQPAGGGVTGGGDNAGSAPSNGQTDDNATDGQSDEANLEYARKATELVLEYLEDGQNRSDRDLLDELGWSKEQMDEFLARWRRLQQTAERRNPQGETARQTLDDVLRGLGLQPSSDRTQRASSRMRQVSGVQDTGGRSQPPASYRDRYKRFLKSLATQRDAAK